MQIKQFRYGVPTSDSTLDYYNPADGLDTKEGIENSAAGLVLWDSTSTPSVGTGSIIKLGVQAPRGFTFRLNYVQTIVVGVTGVFQIDESLSGPITTLELLDWTTDNVIIDFITAE